MTAYYSTPLLDAARSLYPFALLDPRPLLHAYRSIWRVLHVDGFETRNIQFYEPVKYVWSMQATVNGKPVGEKMPL